MVKTTGWVGSELDVDAILFLDVPDFKYSAPRRDVRSVCYAAKKRRDPRHSKTANRQRERSKRFGSQRKEYFVTVMRTVTH